ncbi:HD domain-containing phosphohydrolase [uncultured Oscillibacter sp.]|uniref:HD domain-containing phosphohydrolase n=1 Tax=uncultured Oscillibacter sp. TaxID=876091 RepID=UPI0025D6035E|nr:HD domain-containing phosphohydrolase [uncultured Oscillibacter sp.]
MTNVQFPYQAMLSADTLLIIDDDAINRGILENIFASHYAIEEAENGREGLEKILAHPQRLCAVLLDVVMPEMDGIQVLRALKSHHLTEQVPVFLITAEASGSVMKEAYELGVMDVIGKPVIPYVVLRRVQSVVELYQARARLSGVVNRQQAELLERAEQIVRLNQGMVEALSAAIEFRNGESGQHVRRIHDITHYLLTHTPMGRGLEPNDVENISLAAVMHDVGKIAIPDAILNKPGRLTPAEFEIMKTHTVQGALLLEKIPQMQDSGAYAYACDIARHHHERWDGRGYPDGLRGEEISIWSQVVSLADVYDALTSKRVYKDAFSCEEALRMIRDGECGAFNPALLDAFFSVEPALRALYPTPAPART